MVFFNYSTKLLAAKIVYYGPGLCGKTTNLQYIYNKTSPKARGEMVSLATETDRTLFFDLLPLDVGTIAGFKARFQLYTVPGQVFYNSTRRLVLKGVDAIVFVADSQRPMKDANIESFNNLLDNLKSHNLDIAKIPYVMQYNKRDLQNIYSVPELNKYMNKDNVPFFEAVAITGKGVIDTLKGISKVTIKHLRTKAQEQTSAPAMRPTFSIPRKPAGPIASSSKEEIKPQPQTIHKEKAKDPVPEPAPKTKKKLSLREKLDLLKQKRETADKPAINEPVAKSSQASKPAPEKSNDSDPTVEIKYEHIKESVQKPSDRDDTKEINVDKSIDDLKAMLLESESASRSEPEETESRDHDDVDSLLSGVYSSVFSKPDEEISKETDKLLNEYLLSNVPDIIQEITIDKQFAVSLNDNIYSSLQDAEVELKFFNKNKANINKSFKLQISKPANTNPQRLVINLKFTVTGD